MTRDELNDLGAEILDSCIAVHKELGPGLLESVYVFALKKELEMRGIFSEAEVKVPLIYKGYDTGKYYEMDLLVEEEIIVEPRAPAPRPTRARRVSRAPAAGWHHRRCPRPRTRCAAGRSASAA